MQRREDYVLMLYSAFLGIAATVLRNYSAETLQILGSVMLVLYIAFLYCDLPRRGAKLYYAVLHWDTMILHTMSGNAGCAWLFHDCDFQQCGFYTVESSPVFIAVFAFSFALALGAVWEIYEFTMDSVFGTNMQKYMLDNGTALIGQAALQDTMKDIIVDAIGALVMSTIGYISLKNCKRAGGKLTIRFHVKKPEKAGKTKKGKDE